MAIPSQRKTEIIDINREIGIFLSRSLHLELGDMNTKQIVLLALVVCAVSTLATIAFMKYGTAESGQFLVSGNQIIEKSLQNDDKMNSQNVPDRQINSVLQELALLRAQVGKLEAQQSETKLSEQNAMASVPKDTEEPSFMSSDVAIKQREALVKSHKDILENNLLQEKKDAKWSENAQSKLSSAYSAATSNGIRFVDADCRSTLCKVNISLDQPGKAGEVQLKKLMDKPAPWRGQRFMQVDKQTGDVVMYMMREGNTLPALPVEGEAN
jgi:hypothetical protein